MLVQRRLGARRVVVRDLLIEDRPVAGLLEVRGHRQDQPGRVVVEVAADVVVAALGERLVLVIGAAGRQLRRGGVDDALARALGHHVHEAEQVLVRVAEAHAAADARLVQRGRARHVERHHALVGVPDVDHAVDVLVGRLHLDDAEQVRPVGPQRFERGVDVDRLQVSGDDRLDRALVDRLRAGRIELVVARVLVIAEDEDDRALLARLERQAHLMRAHRLPAVSDRVRQVAALDGQRFAPIAVRPEESVALGIEAGQRLGAGEVGEVIAALAVLGLVIDHAVFDLDLAGAVVALVVRGVVPRIPQRELDAREQIERSRLVALVDDLGLPDLERLTQRDEVARLGGDAAIGRRDRRVAHAVPARVAFERRLGRLP